MIFVFQNFEESFAMLDSAQSGKFVLCNGYIRCAVFRPNFMPPRNREKNCPRPRNHEDKFSAATLSPGQLRGNMQLRNKIPRERAIARKIARECEIARKIARECTVAKISCESAVSLNKIMCMRLSKRICVQGNRKRCLRQLATGLSKR